MNSEASPFCCPTWRRRPSKAAWSAPPAARSPACSSKTSATTCSTPTIAPSGRSRDQDRAGLDGQFVPGDVEQSEPGEQRKPSRARQRARLAARDPRRSAAVLLHRYRRPGYAADVSAQAVGFRLGRGRRHLSMPEKRQGRYLQANDSWGRCVPVDVLEQETGAKRAKVRQLSLFGWCEP